MRIVEQYTKDEIQRRMIRTIKHDLLDSVMRAPVNTFFDLVPVSKIQGKLNGDVYSIIGLFWWSTWVISEFVRTGTTIYLIAKTDYTVLLALLIMTVYLYRGQLYANKTRPEMNRAYGMFESQVHQS